MKMADDFDRDDALDGAAAAWLCEREEGFTTERAQAFAEWRDRDPRHAAAIERVENALALIGEMPAIRAPLEARFGRAGEAIVPLPARCGWRARFSRPAWAAAAAAVLMAGAIAWWNLPPDASTGEHYAADAVTQRRVALRDGSIVDINKAGAVQVDFSGTARRVSLRAGEAHFQVAADPARPFVVDAAGVSVRAVGTAFNVRIADGSVDVLVMEGKVEVVRATARALLTAGECTQVSKDDRTVAPKVEKAAPESIRAALAWQDPMTTFNDVPLRDVAVRFNQRNATQLVIDDAQLGERKIGGVIALDQIEALVRLLEQDGDVVVERRGPGEIRLRRAR